MGAPVRTVAEHSPARMRRRLIVLRAYAARWVAKHVVAGGLARRCTVQLAYAIGVPEPIALNVDVHGWDDVDEDALAQAVMSIFDLTPAGIIRELHLDRPIYKATSVFGHFGRTGPAFTWERTHRTKEIRDEYEQRCEGVTA